jgi:hypothetical protein
MRVLFKSRVHLLAVIAVIAVVAVAVISVESWLLIRALASLRVYCPGSTLLSTPRILAKPPHSTI